MTRKSLLVLGIAASTALCLPTTAFAEGKTDQARKAIAAAQAKIDAANIVGASGDAPRIHAEAVAMLRRAQNELDHHDKDAAINDAKRAAEIADMGLAASQRERNNAQQAAAAAAQNQAADANARAADAQAAAAAAQADAAAARAAPPVVIQQPVAVPVATPAPTSTTVTTTQTDKVATTATAPVKRKVVRRTTARRPAAARVTKTTTTVTTGAQ